MTSFLYRAGSGVPGDISRVSETTVESGLFDQAKVPAAFGLAVKMVAGKVTAIETGDAGINIFGVLTRQAPSIGGDLSESFNSGVPKADAVQGIVTEGYINVLCKVGTPVRGGAVYLCTTANPGTIEVGEFSADAAVGGSGVTKEVTGYSWSVDGKDADNVAELKVSFNNSIA